MWFKIPTKLPSLANERSYKTIIHCKAKQKMATHVCFLNASSRQNSPILPVVVTITRIGPRCLDDDNLAAACKYVRDQIATELGVDDGSSLYTWKYAQRKGRPREYSVEVDIKPREELT